MAKLMSFKSVLRVFSNHKSTKSKSESSSNMLDFMEAREDQITTISPELQSFFDAVSRGNAREVQSIMSYNNIDFNAVNVEGKTAIYLASQGLQSANNALAKEHFLNIIKDILSASDSDVLVSENTTLLREWIEHNTSHLDAEGRFICGRILEDISPVHEDMMEMNPARLSGASSYESIATLDYFLD